ncbi:MAG: GNAT family N-acetyltransferase [Ardenticatenales bacterium]|nr:GNAT family N-acetyltransferase [Ardenticatenales bacterium]
MNLHRLTSHNDAAWDAYLRQQPSALPQQLAAWRGVLEATYGHRTHYLFVTERDEIVGVLPLFFIRSTLLGKKATTMPGGLCANDAVVARALLDAAQEAAQRFGARTLLLHDSRQRWPDDRLRSSSDHHARLIALGSSEEAMWGALQSNVRRQVRIAQRNGLTATLDRSGATLDSFYGCLSRFAHAMGTPLFSPRFLQEVVSAFPDEFSILTIHYHSRHIAAYFQLELNRTVYGMWGAAERETLELRPVYLAYWTLMVDAIGRGFHTLDMGRSPNASGAAQNKAQWGGEERPIYQQLLPLTADSRPQAITTQVLHNPAMRYLRRLWPRLPYPLTQQLGPRLRRHVPFA